MSRKSIGQVHSKVSADCSQFVNEYERADNVSRRRNASIRAEIDKTVAKVGRGFTLPNIAKGLMGGLGIGSGFAVINLAAEKFAALWRESAEHAKTLDERAKSVAESMQAAAAGWKEMVRGFMSPEDKLTSVTKDLGDVGRKVDEQQEIRDRAIRGQAWAGQVQEQGYGVRIKEFEGEKFGGETGMSPKEFGDEMIKRADEAQKRWAELRKEQAAMASEAGKMIDEINKKAQDEARKTAEAQKKERQAAAREMDEAWERAQKAEEERKRSEREQVREAAREMDRAAEAAREATERRVTAYSERWERAAGELRVDDMTKRGMGVGVNYADISKQTNSILSEIRDIIARVSHTGLPMAASD